DGENNQLNWITASEKNVDKFIIEKSNDGEHFQAIGIVGATGNTSETQSDGYLDTEAWQGVTYYRLRIMDEDQKYEFSHIIIIDVKKDQHALTETKVLTVYPNPTDAKTTVEMYVQEAEADFDVKVVNVLGQVMHTEKLYFTKGKAS